MFFYLLERGIRCFLRSYRRSENDFIKIVKIMDETTNKKRINFKFWSREKDLKILKFVAIFIIVAASLIIIKDEISWQLDSSLPSEDVMTDENDSEEAACNVLGIELHGDLVTYIPPSETDANENNGEPTKDQTASENIVYAINEAEKDSSIKAIILEVDSYGGYPVAGEEVAIALKKANKPTIALVREGGASAAYMAASGADKIFASKNSDVGSIAVTMSYLDYVRQNQKEGLTYIPLSSGKFKDTGDPNKTLNQEEKNLLMRDVNILHENFIKMVAENRNLDIEKVETMADGSTMLGEMALKNGLIDQIGGIFEVKEFLKEKIGEDVEICW